MALRWLFDPKANDRDEPHAEAASAVAQRFVRTLEAKNYSELWHTLVAPETTPIFAMQAFLHGQAELAETFGLPANMITPEFLQHVLANDLDRVRTGLLDGIRRHQDEAGWFARRGAPRVAFTQSGALVTFSGASGLIVPLVRHGNSMLVDLETYVVASRTLRVEEFLSAARSKTDNGDFEDAMTLLRCASRLSRPHGVLREHAWLSLLKGARVAELRSDAALLAQVDVELRDLTDVAALDISRAVHRDEDERTDFKESLPSKSSSDNQRRTAQVLASFATGGGGVIYFGIADDRRVITINEAQTMEGRDQIRQLFDHVCRDAIKPALSVRVRFLPYNDGTGARLVPVVIVPSGTEPVYYARNIPYLRRGQSSSPAEPHEVVDLVRKHLFRVAASKIPEAGYADEEHTKTAQQAAAADAASRRG